MSIARLGAVAIAYTMGGLCFSAMTSARAQDQSAELRQYTQPILAARVANCSGKTYVLWGGGGTFKSKGDLLEVKRLTTRTLMHGLNEVARLNGVEWSGEVLVGIVAHRFWFSDQRSWSNWRTGHPLPLFDSLAKMVVYKTSGRIASRQPDPHSILTTLIPIDCAKVSAMLGSPTDERRGDGSQQSPAIPATRTESLPRVDPKATTILAGGFVGLRVGHTLSDAAQFFGNSLVPYLDGVSPADAGRCGVMQPNKAPQVSLLTRDQKVVGFRVSDPRYETVNALRVGDSEAKLAASLRSTGTFKRHSSTHGEPQRQLVYYSLDGDKATSIRFYIEQGKVDRIEFGATRELGGDEGRC